MQTLIENVNIITPGEDIKTHQNVLIEDNLIKTITHDKISNDCMVIDGEDNYLLPGFIDCHTHIFAKGFHKEENMANPLGIHFYNAVPHSKQTINAGVTTIRDCGSADLSFKLAQQRKLFIAPKIHLSITPLVMTGGHFDLLLPSGWDMEIMYPGFPKGRCDGVEEVLKKTREVKRAGADFIKVMCSGGVLTTNTSPNFAQFNKKELKTIVSEARSSNMKVSAHCHSLEGINNCIKAGFSSIEHATFIDKKAAGKMAKNNVSLVPTLLVHQFLYKNGFPAWDNYASEKTAKLKEIVKVHKENIAVAYQEGVNILMGTDSGVIPHGHNLEELVHLTDIGMSETEAIASGTIKAAEFLGQDNIGQVKKNHVADLILVNSNPLDDISVLSNNDNILNVFQDGVLVK
ncbi:MULTISPECIES: amidohydrolase family protein [Methanobrevibacter]|uniref:metal-dependent hydrolase family protein n=1 Tax=Methanobrevibacter TaxID=2172 RepID=UPI0026EA24AF|nr:MULTISPECIES: amidohydrolase family protein [Methanobrevibacter]MBS7257851.1 amidohydrolase family protein [Methanobrevibacter sp.]MCI7427614.1 amidohydrolase family protein [Methanobrevibacter sp.]MDY3097241.1 amidohydrolase family protein [Methanobrevibacter sp.]